jgi:hypothetical protein
MRIVRSLMLFACLLTGGGASAIADSLPRFDHHDPADLNEAALRLLKVGDGGTARILLERAAVLSPEDPVVRGNLLTLRAYQDGTGEVRVATVTPDGFPAASPEMTAMPAPWPSRGP